MLAQLGSLISHFELLNDTAFLSNTPFFAGICHGGLRAVNQCNCELPHLCLFVHKLLLLPMSQFKVVKFWSNNKGISSPSALSRCNDLFNLLKIAYPLWAAQKKNLIEVVQVNPPFFWVYNGHLLRRHVLANEIYHGGLCTFSGKSCSVSSIGHWGSNLNWLSAHHGTCRTSLEVSAPGSLKLSMWTVHGFSPSRLLSDILELMRSRLTAQANLKWYIK